MNNREPNTVPVAKLSNLSMVAGGEKKHPVVIHEGVVKRWVGFGWVEEGKPSKKDREDYPEAEEREEFRERLREFAAGL